MNVSYQNVQRHILFSCLLGLLASAIPAGAEVFADATVSPVTTTHSEHPQLAVSASLTFEDILKAAHSRAPQRQFNSAYQQLAEDQRHVAGQLVAGAPRLNLSYWDDEANDATGLREIEASVEVDLWQWGQKDNAQRLADNLRSGADSWQGYLLLTLAGDLRSSLHRLDIADARVEHAQQAVTEAEALLRTSQSMLQSGAASRHALLQSEALVLEAEQYLLNEQAEKVDAERYYVQLTGLLLRPAVFSESPPQQAAISLAHPELRFLHDQRQQQADRVERARYEAVDSTSVSFGVRHERGSAQEPEIESLGIAVSIPFGGGRHRSAKASTEAIALTDADVRLHQTQRRLTAQLHEVEHQLEVTDQSIIYAAKNVELQKERWQMTQKAFSLGESDIQPTILSLREYSQSALQLRLLQLQRTALISSLKQTLGELP